MNEQLPAPRPGATSCPSAESDLIARCNGSCVNVASQANPSGDRSQSRRHAAQAAEAHVLGNPERRSASRVHWWTCDTLASAAPVEFSWNILLRITRTCDVICQFRCSLVVQVAGEIPTGATPAHFTRLLVSPTGPALVNLDLFELFRTLCEHM